MENLNLLNLLKEEFEYMKTNRKYSPNICNYLMYLGYKENYGADPLTAKARAIAKLFTAHEKHIYDNDLIAGSVCGKFADKYTSAELNQAERIADGVVRTRISIRVLHLVK